MPEQTKSNAGEGVGFVVLQHADSEGLHFDLMIDMGPSLATWKCPQPPDQTAGSGLNCLRLKDHRRLYLDYEGPISDGRGSVQRYDQGVCMIHERAPRRWEVTFAGQRLVGRFALLASSGEGDEWCLRLVPGS
jgi:hypothetical protein